MTLPVEPSPQRPPVVRTLVLVAVFAFVLGTFGGPVGGLFGALGTAAHEAGHAVAADVLTGDVISVTVFPDGGGVTVSTAGGGDVRRFVVAGAGYPATLVAALALLTAVFFGATARAAAIGGAVVSGFVWVFYTPFNSAVPGVSDGEQRFTWVLLLLATAAFAGIAAAPPRFDGTRRIALGVLAAGLLTDAFSAGSDLVAIEDVAGATRTDADGLADAAGFGSATFWAWSMRASLFAIAAIWVLLTVRSVTDDDETGPDPSPAA